jgi:hypothetical protein
VSLRTLYERHFNTIKTVAPEDRAALAQAGKPQDGSDLRDKAVEEAKRRHSKQFRCDVLVPRETPPSRDLVEMNELSVKRAGMKVTAIKKERRG